MIRNHRHATKRNTATLQSDTSIHSLLNYTFIHPHTHTFQSQAYAKQTNTGTVHSQIPGTDIHRATVIRYSLTNTETATEAHTGERRQKRTRPAEAPIEESDESEARLI